MLRSVRCAAVVLASVLLLVGCSLQQSVGGWFGGDNERAATEAAAPKPQEYYSGRKELRVYSAPTSSSQVVGKLALHEKVSRFKIERGYAYVKAHTSGLMGWVDNAALIWQLPAATHAPAKGAAEAPMAEPTSAPATPESQDPVSAPEPPPSTTPTPGAVPPSLFDPY